jgi:hypothetical protein
LKNMFYSKLREINDEFDQLKLEQDEFRNRLEIKEKNECKFITKIKALESMLNTSAKSTESQLFDTEILSEQFVPDVKIDLRIEKKDHQTSKTHSSPIKSIKNCFAKHFSHQIPCPVDLANLNQAKPTTPNSKLHSILSNKKAKQKSRSDGCENILIQNQDIVNPTEMEQQISNKILQTEIHTRYEYREEVQNYTRPASPIQPSPSTYNQPISSKSIHTSKPNVEKDVNAISRGETSVFLRTGIPVANRRGRRAKSFETWLDHRPCSLTKLGLLFFIFY